MDQKNFSESSFPIFADPKHSWSGGALADEGPFFRQLPVPRPIQDVEPNVRERRGAVRRDMQLGIEVYGYDGELSLIHAYGTTVEGLMSGRHADFHSASGLFAFVDVDMPIGSRAVVAVRPSHPALEPTILRGKVVRCDPDDNGYGLAIHFDLDVERFAFQVA